MVVENNFVVIMSALMPKKRAFIARHVLEVRFKEKNFSFLDFYGELIDAIHSATGFSKVRAEGAGNRIQLEPADHSIAYFFSLENFGFQIEAAQDMESFNDHVARLFAIIESFPKFKTREILRLGTKSSFFCYIPSRAEEGIRQLFFNQLFANQHEFERATGMDVTDISFSYFSTKADPIKCSIVTGPANLNEVIDKVFQKSSLYENFSHKSGVYYEVDAYTDDLGLIDSTQIRTKIAAQIGVIEKSFNGYMDLFREKTK